MIGEIMFQSMKSSTLFNAKKLYLLRKLLGSSFETKMAKKILNFESIATSWKTLCSKCFDLMPFVNEELSILTDITKSLSFDAANDCVLGAVLAQEIIKNLTGQGLPIIGLFTFSADNNSAIIYS